MSYCRSTSSWKPGRWVTLELIFTMRDIYINSNLNPLSEFPSSSRSTKFKDILPLNTSQMIRKTVLIIMRIVISYTMKQGIHPLLKLRQQRDQNFPIEGKPLQNNTSVRWKKQIQNSRSRKVNHLRKVIWHSIKNCA